MSLEHDPIRKRGFKETERVAFSIAEFCDRNGISRSMYYKMRAAGTSPRVMTVGRRQIITREAESDWQMEREDATEVA